MAILKFAEGSAALSPETLVCAGDLGRWNLTFTAGEGGLPGGAVVRVSVPDGFTPPQTGNPAANGYVRVETDNRDASLSLVVDPTARDGFDPFTGQDRTPGVYVLVGRTPLKSGEAFTLTYGAGPGQACASEFACQAPFPTYVCMDGKAHPERFFPIRKFPALEVVAGKPVRLTVTVPSGGEMGRPLSLRVTAQDDAGNRCKRWGGWLEVVPDVPGVQVPVPQRVEDPTGEGVALSVGLVEPRQNPFRLRVRESETGVEGVSNPILVGGKGPFWGDLHACLPEGEKSDPSLDFELTVGPVPTVEIGSFHFATKAHPEGFSPASTGVGQLRVSLPDAQSDEMLHTHLLEVYSCWGNREYWGASFPDVRFDRHPDRTVHAVLAQGIVAGLVAGSNSRFGVAGDAIRAEAERGYRGGLTAVQTESTSRDDLFAALRERRCYATTGARMLLHVEVGGYPMGRLVEVGAENRSLYRERHVSVQVHGTAPIDRIEVIRNNVEVCTYRGDGEDGAFQWTDRQDLTRLALQRPKRGGALSCYYYIRATQVDGEIAWSSPVWFVIPRR